MNLQFIASKLFSARFWMAIMFTATACYCMITAKLSSEAFMALAGAAVHAYFSDRKLGEEKPEDKNGKV